MSNTFFQGRKKVFRGGELPQLRACEQSTPSKNNHHKPPIEQTVNTQPERSLYTTGYTII